MKLVVARYNEDVEWTKEYDNVLIYNKGAPLIGYTNVIELPNVGREGHTYYYHIYTNYDTLDEYTVFLQGNPFDHTPNLSEIIKRMQNFNGTFTHICKSSAFTNNINCDANPKLRMLEAYEELFGDCTEIKQFWFGIGAQFIVSKDCIHRRPREFYKTIVDMLNKEINPLEGYIIERYHTLIFD